MIAIPKELDIVLSPGADREIAAQVLEILKSTPATCAAEVSQTVGCSYVTAEKHLAKTVEAGLAVEKRLGKVRVFISKKQGLPTGGDQE